MIKLTTFLVGEVDAHDSQADSHHRVRENEQESSPHSVDKTSADTRCYYRHDADYDSSGGGGNGGASPAENVHCIVDHSTDPTQSLERHQSESNGNRFCGGGSGK